MYEQRDKSVSRKHQDDYIEATGVQLKPETYIEWSIALTLSARGPTLASESDVCRRQILTLKSIPVLKE